jgi:hypothetical protein
MDLPSLEDALGRLRAAFDLQSSQVPLGYTHGRKVIVSKGDPRVWILSDLHGALFTTTRDRFAGDRRLLTHGFAIRVVELPYDLSKEGRTQGF